MPSQEEHDKPENLVESPHKKTHSAHSLEDAADSNATLEGYYAMNNIKPPADAEDGVAQEAGDASKEKGRKTEE